MDYGNRAKLSALIKEKAYSLGFELCGIARAGKLKEYESVFRDWCSRGMNDGMTYLARDVEKRLDPRILFPGTESVIVTGLNYYTEKIPEGNDIPVISRYAYGNDYHRVVADKLEKLMLFITGAEPFARGKICCDSSALLEKHWAVRAGLGWQGKNSLVINENIGSFFFIGIILLNIPLEYDKQIKTDRCGDCRECIEHCPTQAINDNRTVDARKCISGITIESRNPVPAALAPLFGKRVFGCDVCQEVCPWNKNAKPHAHHELNISEEFMKMTVEDWKNMTREKFERLFGHTPVIRTGYERFRRNLDIIMKWSYR